MTPGNETISVIIPVLNGSRTLRKTLQTIREQKDFDFEIVVVDDGSSEDITALVREMGARFHRLPETRGPATARTEGAKIAEGEILLFTDSDVWLPTGALAKIRKTFAQHDCECVQGTFSKNCPHSNFFSQYKNLYNRYVLGLLGPWIDTTYTSITAVKKQFFFESEGFDLNIRGASVEDRTLGENLTASGGKIYLDHSLEVVHNKRLSMGGFLRSQYKRSRDLAKLMLRQRESGFLGKGASFGTNTKGAMLRLPFALGTLFFLIVGLGFAWSLFGAGVCLVLYLGLSRKWIAHLAREKGIAFALRGQIADFADAVISGIGVLIGTIEFKSFGKRY
jgi:glycosyltransferase involved in cell wall biosynthesis